MSEGLLLKGISIGRRKCIPVAGQPASGTAPRRFPRRICRSRLQKFRRTRERPVMEALSDVAQMPFQRHSVMKLKRLSQASIYQVPAAQFVHPEQGERC